MFQGAALTMLLAGATLALLLGLARLPTRAVATVGDHPLGARRAARSMVRYRSPRRQGQIVPRSSVAITSVCRSHRIVHNAHGIQLCGESRRKQKAQEPG